MSYLGVNTLSIHDLVDLELAADRAVSATGESVYDATIAKESAENAIKIAVAVKGVTKDVAAISIKKAEEYAEEADSAMKAAKESAKEVDAELEVAMKFAEEFIKKSAEEATRVATEKVAAVMNGAKQAAAVMESAMEVAKEVAKEADTAVKDAKKVFADIKSSEIATKQ